MKGLDTPVFQTAQLLINTATGEVARLAEQQIVIRLSPVNKRVLLELIQHQGQAVSRQKLFDAVWPNQVISEDALTRCISDLRAQLKPLTDITPLIGTIPKVGYRWLPKVEAFDANEAAAPGLNPYSLKKSRSDKFNQQDVVVKEKESLWNRQLKPMLMAFSILALLLLILAFSYDIWGQSRAVSLVILPTQQSSQSSQPVDDWLKQAIQKHKSLQYLSQYAYQSHEGNPFPYFSHHFGVRWFIESQIEQDDSYQMVTLNLVDAKNSFGHIQP